jgi:hypothetical protein
MVIITSTADAGTAITKNVRTATAGYGASERNLQAFARALLFADFTAGSARMDSPIALHVHAPGSIGIAETAKSL